MQRTFLQMAYVFLILACADLNWTYSQQIAERQAVTIRVELPAADAELLIDEHPTRLAGTSRVFTTPPLETGNVYHYLLTARWRPNNYTTITRTRKLTFHVGPEVVADLTKADEKNPDKIVVRYVPTPEIIVDAMCKLAKVQKDDVVYDLGCGDGRIVITAVAKFEAKRGVGVDIDPERIRESRMNARRQGVEDKVTFRQGDVLKLEDLSEATVVMLYMGEDLNLRLRPILQRLLKPGARVVSHRFTMGDWKPEKTETLTDKKGEKYLIHLWKIGQGEKAKPKI